MSTIRELSVAEGQSATGRLLSPITGTSPEMITEIPHL